jgi:hypothetical protein
MWTGSNSTSVRVNSAQTPGIVSKAPGQLSRLCGHESQVATRGAHSAGMK